MEGYAALHHVPIINERGRQAFLQVVQEAKPHRVLEIGTAIGYSSLLMAQNGAADIDITTLELSDERIKTAQGYIDRSAYADRIHIMGGDAAENLLKLQLKRLNRRITAERFGTIKETFFIVGINYDKDSKVHQCLIEKYHN